MSHDQLQDCVFVKDDVLDARRRAQTTQLRQERRRLVLGMMTDANRISKIDSLLTLLE